ncbi:hypothetical protein NIES298_03480 [Microcystis aeruginosa NIES-298]|nr:hypothetical protein NIES298_03480 [Microcystis aeruginosa NIES-298]
MLKTFRHPPYQGGIPPPIGTPLIKGGSPRLSAPPLSRGDPPAYRHPPYQGGQGGSIFNLIITSYLSTLLVKTVYEQEELV